MLYKNNFAVLGMPVYLTVAVITASAVFAIFVYSILNVTEESQTDIVKKQIEKIITDAENMFEYAESGSKIKIEVDFPHSMNFAIFGKMAESIYEPTNLELNESISNNYYFVMQNREVCSYSSNARFCGKETDEIAILHHGEYPVFLELVYSGGKTYVKIY